MINEPTTTHEQVRALAVAVHNGELTPGQRECLIDLLHSLGTAATLAQRAHYRDNDVAALGYLIATPGSRSSGPTPSWLRRSGLAARGAPRSLSGYPFAEVRAPGAALCRR